MRSIYFTDPNGIALEASWWVTDATGRDADYGDRDLFGDLDPVPASASWPTTGRRRANAGDDAHPRPDRHRRSGVASSATPRHSSVASFGPIRTQSPSNRSCGIESRRQPRSGARYISGCAPGRRTGRSLRQRAGCAHRRLGGPRAVSDQPALRPAWKKSATDRHRRRRHVVGHPHGAERSVPERTRLVRATARRRRRLRIRGVARRHAVVHLVDGHSEVEVLGPEDRLAPSNAAQGRLAGGEPRRDRRRGAGVDVERRRRARLRSRRRYRPAGAPMSRPRAAASQRAVPAIRCRRSAVDEVDTVDAHVGSRCHRTRPASRAAGSCRAPDTAGRRSSARRLRAAIVASCQQLPLSMRRSTPTRR